MSSTNFFINDHYQHGITPGSCCSVNTIAAYGGGQTHQKRKRKQQQHSAAAAVPILSSNSTRTVGMSSSSFNSNSHNNSNNKNGNNNDDDEVITNNVEIDLVKEMNELSVAERNKLYEEVHGVAQPPDESPDFVAQAITEFDDALQKFPKSRKKALDRALFLKPSLAFDTNFKLLFLRGDYFNTSKAVTKMVKHFDLKLKLFGEEKLVKDITLDDLPEEDVQEYFVNCGISIILPRRDPNGRQILFCDTNGIVALRNMGGLVSFFVDRFGLFEPMKFIVHIQQRCFFHYCLFLMLTNSSCLGLFRCFFSHTLTQT